MKFDEYGEGQAVVLIHGFPLNRSEWKPVIPLIQNKARIIVPDLRGFGETPPGAEKINHMTIFADDIAGLLDRLGIQKVILAGHSMGGYISLAFWNKYSARLAGIILVASQPAGDTEERRKSRLMQVEGVQARGAVDIADSMKERLSSDTWVQEVCYQMMIKTSPEVIVATLQGLAAREDFQSRITEITTPVCVLAGRKDKMVPIDRATQVARDFPNGWLVEAKNSGHMPMLEQPEAVAEAVSQMLERV